MCQGFSLLWTSCLEVYMFGSTDVFFLLIKLMMGGSCPVQPLGHRNTYSPNRWESPWLKKTALLPDLPTSWGSLCPVTGGCRGVKTLLPQFGVTLQDHPSFSFPWGSAEALIVTGLQPTRSLFLFCFLPFPSLPSPTGVNPNSTPQCVSAQQSPFQSLLLGEPDL